MSMPEQWVPNDSCVQGKPINQNLIDLIDGWVSELPPEVGVRAGSAALFADGRTDWAIAQLDGVKGQSVLELGPLEGGHTYMLHQAGARVTAIEANKRAYIKCLITKELLGLIRARFLLGDFMAWMETDRSRFDLVWATGVLYHMGDPTGFLRLIAARTNRVHIWTHYVPDRFNPNEEWASPILGVEQRDIAGREVPHYLRTYFDTTGQPLYCGGIYTKSAWLRRSDILLELEKLGFGNIEIGFETTTHPHGPCFALVATKKG